MMGIFQGPTFPEGIKPPEKPESPEEKEPESPEEKPKEAAAEEREPEETAAERLARLLQIPSPEKLLSQRKNSLRAALGQIEGAGASLERLRDMVMKIQMEIEEDPISRTIKAAKKDWQKLKLRLKIQNMLG